MVQVLNGVRRPMGAHSWPIEEYPFAARTQIPLRLAWAVTTHRSQGASLDSALVDIGASNFEYGQAYVALSRARSLEALYVHDFDPMAFRAHPKVKAFYRDMQGAVMEQEERERLRRLTEPEKADTKAVFSETSKPILGLRVIRDEFPVETLDEKEKEPGST